MDTPALLASEEWARIDRGARRLHSAIGSLISALPPSARHASALARHLRVDRTTCQRAVHAATRPYPGPELLTRLPGVRALHMLAEASSKAHPPADPGVVDGLVAAVDQVQGLVAELGGSMSRLSRRLKLGRGDVSGAGATPAGTPGRGALDARRRLSAAAAELTGRSSRCWVAVYAYRPHPEDPGLVEVFRANGLIGHVASADAVPLVVHNFSDANHDPTDKRFASLEDDPLAGRSPTVVLEEFSTSPAPLVTSRQPEKFLVQSIDEQPGSTGSEVDLMLATRTTIPHPATLTLPVEEVWAMINFPSRHLLLDVWLHRDLARTCVPSLDAHLWAPDFTEHVSDRWQTRFADSPVMQLLGPGLPRHAPPAYPRHAELIGHLFDRVGLDAGEFVGHRCDVAWPLWRAGYCMRLDFSGAERTAGDAR